MKLLKCIGYGAIGGLVGAALWAGVAVVTNREIGWIAWLVGFATGLGVRFAAGESEGALPGILAAVLAVLAVFGGKYFAVHLAVEKAIGSMGIVAPTSHSDEQAISEIADDLSAQYKQKGKPLVFPAEKGQPNATIRQQYPRDVWDEAQKTWNAKTPPQREEFKKQMAEHAKATVAMFNGAFREEMRKKAFEASFTPFDILWFLLAVVTAFKLGSGSFGSSD